MTARKKFVGREIALGVIVHVAEDVKPETIEALKELARCAIKISDEDLREVKFFADYLQDKRHPKHKVGRPRKPRSA